ncbi:hypothetical protein J7U46_05165 [Pelomonas sp. V22]|uniref:hypothetical protein n=1 Tax=Pelomonas sp. V22 TaxID=2822139 RepID=UPI0024A9CEDC|nr:hypothetical protein [Pelomonas sp. V22]MDI4632426.1 hypothetical protein [Pelomonas sp. V22]
MAQHRDAPAFQEYAASMMARTEYRVLSLEERGLLYTMRLECWVNGSLPDSTPMLARVLGYDVAQVERALAGVSAFFTFDDGLIRCPELDDYRAHLDERKKRQSEGGKAGAAKTNKGRNRSPTGRAAPIPRLGRESLVQNSPVQKSKTQGIQQEAVHDAWMSEYEAASNGH